MNRRKRLFHICLALAMAFGILAGLSLWLAADSASYECYDASVLLAHLNGDVLEVPVRLQAGDYLQVDAQAAGGNVSIAVLDAQGEEIPVNGRRALAPATGGYTLRFCGQAGAFRAMISYHRKMEE